MAKYFVESSEIVIYRTEVEAETPEAVIQMLKTSLEEKYGEGQEAMWGNFNVTVKEVDLNEQKIILQMLCAG